MNSLEIEKQGMWVTIFMSNENTKTEHNRYLLLFIVTIVES